MWLALVDVKPTVQKSVPFDPAFSLAKPGFKQTITKTRKQVRFCLRAMDALSHEEGDRALTRVRCRS